MLFKCDRRVPQKRGTPTLVVFTLEADDGPMAIRAADELAYALAWKRGVYPDSHKGIKSHKTKPDKWTERALKGIS